MIYSRLFPFGEKASDFYENQFGFTIHGAEELIFFIREFIQEANRKETYFLMSKLISGEFLKLVE